jgi:hypothetical protein
MTVAHRASKMTIMDAGHSLRRAGRSPPVMVQHGGSFVRAFLICKPILNDARRSIVPGSR